VWTSLKASPTLKGIRGWKKTKKNSRTTNPAGFKLIPVKEAPVNHFEKQVVVFFS